MSCEIPDPVGIDQLAKIKLRLVWRGKVLEFNQRQKLFIPGETIQNVITSAKWNLNPENSNAWSPRRQGKKVASIFYQR